jgi:hypothetical protein
MEFWNYLKTCSFPNELSQKYNLVENLIWEEQVEMYMSCIDNSQTKHYDFCECNECWSIYVDPNNRRTIVYILCKVIDLNKFIVVKFIVISHLKYETIKSMLDESIIIQIFNELSYSDESIYICFEYLTSNEYPNITNLRNQIYELKNEYDNSLYNEMLNVWSEMETLTIITA